MADCCEGASCGRSDCPCKKEAPKSCEESHSTSNSKEEDSSEAEWIEVDNFSERVVGKDGSYYDCDVCHGVGTLLCCDTCPSTFHLGCLEPPLGSVPPGIWQCQKCWPRDDSSASSPSSKHQKRSDSFSKVKHSPSPSISSSVKKQSNEKSDVPVDSKSRSSASDEKLPAASSHSPDKLVEAGDGSGKASGADSRSENQGKSASDSGESGSQRFEIKVYERSMKKKKLCTEEGAKLGASSGVGSDRENDGHKDKPAHNPVEIDRTPLEEDEGEAVLACPDLNEKPYSESANTVLRDKVLIPRDISQASANSHFLSQNDELSDSLPEARLGNAEPSFLKKRLVYLRARQKARIAKRVKKVGESAPGAGPSRTEGPVQFHGRNSGGFSGPSNRFSGNGVVPIPAIPLRMLRPEDAGIEVPKQSSEKTYGHKYSSVNLSVNNHNKRSNHNQERYGDHFAGSSSSLPTKEAPNPEGSTVAGSKRQKTGLSQLPSPLPITLPAPQPRDVLPPRSSASDVYSGFRMPGTEYNNLRTTEVDEPWSNKELDSLWIGVRRYGQGNWLLMRTDPNLCFSTGKSAEDLATRWEKEKANYLGPQVATNDKPNSDESNKGKKKMMDIDLNVVPAVDGKEKGDEPKTLVGIHIEIPAGQKAPDAGGISPSQMQMQEPILREGGISPNQMPIQEPVSRAVGSSPNLMPMLEPVPRADGSSPNQMPMLEPVPRAAGGSPNQMPNQEPVSRAVDGSLNLMPMVEPVSRAAGNGGNQRQREVVVISSDSDSEATVSS